MFPASILVGTYEASGGGGNGGNGGSDPNTISYDSFKSVGVAAYFMAEFNSKLYYFPTSGSRIKESSDSGSTWGNASLTANVAIQRRPVVESSQILFIDGTSSNNSLDAWDGSSTTATNPVSGTSSLSQIESFHKIDSYYYISDFAGPFERSTALGSGWSTAINAGRGRFIVKGGNTFVVTLGNTLFVSTDDFANETNKGNLNLLTMATDGSGNWVGGGTSNMYFSTNDGSTWTTTELRASGDTSNISLSYDGNIVYINNKWIYLDSGNKKLLSFTGTPTATPTVTTEYDFTSNSATSNPLGMNKIGNVLYVTDYYNSQYGYHKINLT